MMQPEVTMTEAEESLLRGSAIALRAQVDGEATKLEGFLAVNRALKMEIELYVHAVDKIIRENRVLRDRNVAETLRANVAEERAANGELLIAQLRAELAARSS